jgi:asparagine synthase (glutamine-hydrolysing)
MCGIAGIVGQEWNLGQLVAMVSVQRHRGPDSSGTYRDPTGIAGLGHSRLSIIDLSTAGRQPMTSADSRYWIVFNGEIYNYKELRAELTGFPFRTQTDTEVILGAYVRWGSACLDHFVGMFAFAIWDEQEKCLFAARDRFGVKPFYYHARPGGTWLFASEIKALHVSGIPVEADLVTWASYLALGLSDHSDRTFWEGVRSLPPGHALEWRNGQLGVFCWYNLSNHIGDEWDHRPDEDVEDEYGALLKESVRLRFRADVPVGINLSGGLDSSTLLGLVQAVQGPESEVKAFTFVTGSAEYDELPWVHEMLRRTRHPSVVCRLMPEVVPALAESVAWHQDEPFGGLPSLAYAKLFERARQEGVIVLLDGQGMDEKWAGYDYYRGHCDQGLAPLIQGVMGSAVRPECLIPEFRRLAEPLGAVQSFPDRLRNLQYRDIRFTKIPKALRFNDRISMRSSTELREPFLDHRLVEFAFRQPASRKLRGESSKYLLRQLTRRLLPGPVREAPKRPVQTPQREWLQFCLRGWADDQIEAAISERGGAWLDRKAVRAAWRDYVDRGCDNSFFLWQWISVGLMAGEGSRRAQVAAARAAAATGNSG